MIFPLKHGETDGKISDIWKIWDNHIIHEKYEAVFCCLGVQSCWECVDDLDACLVYEVVTKLVTGPHSWDSPIFKMSCNTSEQLLR
jgi:hypothetical protein